MPDRVSSPFTRQEYGIQSRPGGSLREVRPAVDLDATLPLVPRRPAAPQALTMRCLCCHGLILRSTTQVSIERGACRLSWEEVPAWVCSRCGKSYFEPPEVERIRAAARAVSTLDT
jgi:YgiT-type zinc finger domain-containing protein